MIDLLDTLKVYNFPFEDVTFERSFIRAISIDGYSSIHVESCYQGRDRINEQELTFASLQEALLCDEVTCNCVPSMYVSGFNEIKSLLSSYRLLNALEGKTFSEVFKLVQKASSELADNFYRQEASARPASVARWVESFKVRLRGRCLEVLKEHKSQLAHSQALELVSGSTLLRNSSPSSYSFQEAGLGEEELVFGEDYFQEILEYWQELFENTHLCKSERVDALYQKYLSLDMPVLVEEFDKFKLLDKEEGESTAFWLKRSFNAHVRTQLEKLDHLMMSELVQWLRSGKQIEEEGETTYFMVHLSPFFRVSSVAVGWWMAEGTFTEKGWFFRAPYEAVEACSAQGNSTYVPIDKGLTPDPVAVADSINVFIPESSSGRINNDALSKAVALV